MTEEEMIARGQEIFEKCYNGVVPMPKVEPKGMSGMSMKMFNDFWGDDTLSFREKRLLVMGVLAGMGADASLFEIHAKSALRNGELSPGEIHAALLMTLPYVGYPRASPLYRTVEKAIAEYEKE